MAVPPEELFKLRPGEWIKKIKIDKHFGNYKIAECPVPAWLMKAKAGKPVESLYGEKGSYMQVSRSEENHYCFFLYGCDWPAGEIRDPERNSYLSIEWDGTSPNALVGIGMDDNQRLLGSEFDADGVIMAAQALALGYLLIPCGGDEVNAMNERQVAKARKFLAQQFLAKMETGQAEAFGKALDGKRRRIIEIRDSLENWNGQDYWTENEDEITRAIGEVMKAIAMEQTPRPLTRGCILEQINLSRRDAKPPKGKHDPARYKAVDDAWLSRKITKLGLAWI